VFEWLLELVLVLVWCGVVWRGGCLQRLCAERRTLSSFLLTPPPKTSSRVAHTNTPTPDHQPTGRPLIAVEFKHIAMRWCNWLPTVDETAQVWSECMGGWDWMGAV